MDEGREVGASLRQVGGFLTGWTGGRQFPLPSPPSSHFPPLIHFFPPKFRKKYLLIYNILLYKSKSSKNLETFSALLFFCPSLSMNLHSKIMGGKKWMRGGKWELGGEGSGNCLPPVHPVRKPPTCRKSLTNFIT
jgi:hypothetical protein